MFQNFLDQQKILLKKLKLLIIRKYCNGGDKKPPWNVLFFGADKFSSFSLEALLNEYENGNVINVLDVVTTIKNTSNPVKNFADKNNLKLYKWPLDVPKDVYDVGLIVSFGHLIPKKIIESFPFGMINVHASLLPRWRGAAPIIYALANGDNVTGITIMRVKPEKFDIGDIIDQANVEINSTMKMPELYNKLGKLGAQYLIKTLKELPKNLEKSYPQPNEGVTYAPRVNSSFANIKWNNMSSLDIVNLERALTGVFPLTTRWNNIPIKLFEIIECNDENHLKSSQPGGFRYDSKNNTINISCSNKKSISVKQIGVSGKKLMSAKDFYNGYIKKVTQNDNFFS